MTGLRVAGLENKESAINTLQEKYQILQCKMSKLVLGLFNHRQVSDNNKLHHF